MTPALSRIAKLIPRLATDHDGEVIATIRAIEHTLRNSGLAFHDLANALEREPEIRTVIVDRPAASWPPPGRAPQMPWHELVVWCLENDNGRLKLDLNSERPILAVSRA